MILLALLPPHDRRDRQAQKDAVRAQKCAKRTRRARLAKRALRLRVAGFRVEAIARVLDVSPRTVYYLLEAHQAELGGKRRGRTPFVFTIAQPTNRYHFAEALGDLWELIQQRVAQGGAPVRYSDWCRIRGEDERVRGKLDRSPAWRVFYRMQALLTTVGIQFERVEDEEHGSAVILTNWEELAAFVRREIGPASRVLEAYKARTGATGRFRGR